MEKSQKSMDIIFLDQACKLLPTNLHVDIGEYIGQTLLHEIRKIFEESKGE